MKPKPFWVLKNFTVPTGIRVPFTLLVGRPRAHRVGGNTPSFGSSLEAQPKLAACQQDEAENQVAGGGIDGIRCKVNGQAAFCAAITGINITLSIGNGRSL